MRVVIFGLGLRGLKHLELVGRDVVATVDPINQLATNKSFTDIDPESFDIGIVATNESSKKELLDWLISNKKHILVEKPLLYSADQLKKWNELATANRILLRVAYNHRYEFGTKVLQKILNEQSLGRPYRMRFFYGNGTAQNIKASKWRNYEKAVSADLLSHLLDLAMYLCRDENLVVDKHFQASYEISGSDHSILIGSIADVDILLESSYISWNNKFEIELIAEFGSILIQGLDKWNNQTICEYDRVFPSGPPKKKIYNVPPNFDSTKKQWEIFLKDLTSQDYCSNLSYDIQIAKILSFN